MLKLGKADLDLIDHIESISISFIGIVDADKCSDDTRCISSCTIKSISEVLSWIRNTLDAASKNHETGDRNAANGQLLVLLNREIECFTILRFLL